MNSKTYRIAVIGLLSAIAYVLMVVGRVPVVLFLRYDPKDVVITLGGLIWGPMTSFLVSVIVSLIEMFTVSETGLWGLVMNILSSCMFACTAAVIYKKNHTLRGAIAGLSVGAVFTVAAMMLWNYLITPIYMGYPREAVVKLLLPAFLPFNLIKVSLNAAFTFLLYKPLITALRKSGAVPASEESGKTSHLGLALIAAAVIFAGVLLILAENGII